MKLGKTIRHLGIFILAGAIAQATVTINFEGGLLFGRDTDSPLADGSLVYAVALPSGTTFGGPTDTSFVGEGEIFLGKGTTDSAVAGDGSFSIALPGIPLIGGLEEGMDVWLVWFPDLRQDSISPSAGLVYGAYHGNDWIIPADGARVNLSVETGSIGGPVPDDALVANRQISAVPEPATYAAIFGGLTLAGVLVARRRRATVV